MQLKNGQLSTAFKSIPLNDLYRSRNCIHRAHLLRGNTNERLSIFADLNVIVCLFHL